MAAKMTVVYLDHTGHVLAALREPDSGAPALEALVGAAFPLRAVSRDPVKGSPTFELPASILKAKSVALDPRVIARPQSFAVDGDRVAELPAPATAPSLTDLTQATIELGNLGGTAATPVKVLSIVRGHEPNYREQRVQAGAATAATMTLRLTVVPSGPDAGLASGQSCDVAIAAAGLPLIYGTDTTP